MSQSLIVYAPEVSHLITEDDEPVDNLFSEKQQRLLTEPLYSSWKGPGKGRTFVAMANVGVFYLARNPAIVPDALLSLDVEIHPDFHAKQHRSYFLWEFGKPPDIVIEVVSNKIGEEDGEKMQKYARMRVPYYAILDPYYYLGSELLRVYRLDGYTYRRQRALSFPEAKLRLTLWEGEFEGVRATWLRWADDKGRLIPTGKEKAAAAVRRADKEATEKQVALQEKQAALQEKQAALQEKQAALRDKQAALQRAEKEAAEKQLAQQRAERLAARLRELGVDPDDV